MVEDTGEKKGPGALCPIGLPQPIEVKADKRGWPVEVKVGRYFLPVQVMDRWRIDDEWWREEPVSRAYFMVLVDKGRPQTLFQNLMTARWFRQSQG